MTDLASEKVIVSRIREGSRNLGLESRTIELDTWPKTVMDSVAPSPDKDLIGSSSSTLGICSYLNLKKTSDPLRTV